MQSSPHHRDVFFITRCGLLDRAGGRASLKCLCEVKEKGKSEDGDISTRRRKPRLSHAVGASRVHGVMRFGLCAAPIGEVSGPRRDERGYQSARGCHKKRETRRSARPLGREHKGWFVRNESLRRSTRSSRCCLGGEVTQVSIAFARERDAVPHKGQKNDGGEDGEGHTYQHSHASSATQQQHSAAIHAIRQLLLPPFLPRESSGGGACWYCIGGWPCGG